MAKDGVHVGSFVPIQEEPKDAPQKPPLAQRLRRYPKRLTLVSCVVVMLILALVLGVVFGLRARAAPTTGYGGGSGGGGTAPPPPGVFDGTATLPTQVGTDFPSIQEAFVSFGVEFIFFPDFSGNSSSPNTFSNNLLDNIGNISGTKPYLRVGGNSQDYAIYDANLPTATKISAPAAKTDAPLSNVQIGPSFFEGYSALSNMKFIHGLNLKNATNSPAGWTSLMQIVGVACKALGDGKLHRWEYGNEPDLYPRPASIWNATSYVSDWGNGTTAIQEQLQASCPEMASGDGYGYIGPSLFEINTLPPKTLFQQGLNSNATVKEFSMHHYMGNAAVTPKISLQADMMNHTAIVASLSAVQQTISGLNSGPLINIKDPSVVIPFTLDETNSFLSPMSAPTNMLDVFGAALWTVDYMLYCAAIGLSRVHMQLGTGTGFLYNSWNPVTKANVAIGTAAPYYGNVAVAAMLGNINKEVPTIVQVNIQGADPNMISAYAAYVNSSTGISQLRRVAVINMRAFNATATSASPTPRPTRAYQFALPSVLGIKDGSQVSVQRLMAAGSDVKTGITWDGWSYAHELKQGMPVKMNNVTTGDTVIVGGGTLNVTVPDSSVVIMNF